MNLQVVGGGTIDPYIDNIKKNTEYIGNLKEELGDIESKFEIETEAFSNKCSIIRNNTPNNFTGNQITGVKQYFDFGENAALTKIKMNIKASNDDTVVLEIATLDGNIIATAEKAVTTEYTDVVFDLENIVIKEPVSVFVYTKGTNFLSYGLYSTPYDDQSFSYIFPDGTRKSAFKIGTSKIPKPTTSNNKQCLVLFFDYTSKIIKNISDSISQNIDTTLLKSGKAADAKIVGDKLSNLKEDLSNKITKFYASNHGETHITDSDNGKIQDMIIYGRSSQFTTTGKNLANGQNIKCYINSSKSMCGVTDNDTGMAIDVSKLTSVTISTRSIQDRYRVGCTNTVPTREAPITCYNGRIKDGTKDSYTIDTTDYNYLIVNATKLEDIQVEKGTEVTSYEPYTGGIPSPSLDYPQEIKRVVNPTVKVTNEDGLKVQSVTLNNITLNAIPVSSSGNVIIDGQQYVADYVDVERGKVVRMCGRETLNTKNGEINEEYRLVVRPHTPAYQDGSKECIFSTFKWNSWTTCASGSSIYIKNIKKPNNELYTAQELKELSIDFDVVYQLSEKQETDLTTEQTQALKKLVTNYPVTNISVTSDQLDGYTVFNYPISMANGWNYVKQQLGDTRDYIYDMDAKAQDIDIQSAEAYVNSEYAVALAELEV